MGEGNMSDIEILSDLYLGRFGEKAVSIAKMPGAGGDRVYYRMRSESYGCIGTVADNREESSAFVGLTEVFGKYGVHVPEIYVTSDDNTYYLQEDLGDVTLLSMKGTEKWISVAEATVRELVKLQTVPMEAWGDKVAFKPFSARQVMWDLNYFKYEYLRPRKVPFDEDRLEDDFEVFAQSLTSCSEVPEGFMMRDCQGRNVMVHDDTPWFIDYQGGRRGPVLYDIVSLLWQAKAALSAETRRHLLEEYAEEYHRVAGTDMKILLDNHSDYALFRTLQVLGAYGFRGLVEHRAHFIESIPYALDNLAELLTAPVMSKCAELRKVCEYLCSHNPVPKRHDGLTVKVFSFSYKRGYPEDLTGNGGGFMFDCRGMHNPGRYDQYKPLTGLDEPVRAFLEERGEIQPFLSHAEAMVRPTVERYLARGFNDLQIGFGCTGGRHRSVYSAEALGRRLAELYPEATVQIIHREQNITTTLNEKK